MCSFNTVITLGATIDTHAYCVGGSRPSEVKAHPLEQFYDTYERHQVRIEDPPATMPRISDETRTNSTPGARGAYSL
jgi:hypothetical protein